MLILASLGEVLLTSLIIFFSLFLIALVLVQKNRGGGLSGAFGGVGGYSAFGTKTGDVLTWVTVATTGVFMILMIVANWVFLPDYSTPATAAPPAANVPAPQTPPPNAPPTPGAAPVAPEATPDRPADASPGGPAAPQATGTPSPSPAGPVQPAGDPGAAPGSGSQSEPPTAGSR